ncbi:MAG: ABC transporter permease, partial [Clostridia bacterium]|nr:ABC transporter permease [Clostridia bacterium]
MQPILLILVIALSVAVCITAFHTRIFLREETQLSTEAQSGIADFTVTFSSNSTMRFLFESDIEEAIQDDNAIVCGAFTVPVYFGEEDNFYYGVAADFDIVSHIFDISFEEYTKLHRNQVKTSVFVSREFAEETGAEIGKYVTLKVMNQQKDFVVAGISSNDLLGEYAVMIDITTLVGTIAEDSLFVSLLGDDFVPSTKIFVSVDGDVDQAIADITEKYPDVIVNKITADAVLDSTTRAIVLLIIMLAVFFTFAVIYVCFAVLTAQRQSENALFYAAGAKAYMLNALSIAKIINK